MKDTKTRRANRLPRLRWRAVTAYSFIFVAIPILTYLIGSFLDTMLALPQFPPFPANLLVGFSVFLFGLTIGIKSTRLLYFRGRGLPWGEVERGAQSSRLVTTGLYACCRNPMAFGYSLLPCGMGLLFRSPTMTILVPTVVFSVVIIWLKGWEEPKLEQRFGQIYRDYKRQTPFLIPRAIPLIRDLARSFPEALRSRRTKFVKPVVSGPTDVRCAALISMENRERPATERATDHPGTSELLDDETTRVFQQRLLQWYTRYGRDLPWRHTRDPYSILVSEMMLHQTQVDRVVPKYNEWLTAYPTFEALAAAPLDELRELWRPLGYNYRPERLQRIAQHVVTKLDGTLPHTIEDLMALPGIGRYTAGAILSFAFHQDAPIVDTNVRRVIQRVFGVQGNPQRASARQKIWQLAEALIPPGQAFLFNQALIDFGALVCTARDPACPACVFKDLCRGRMLCSTEG